MNEKRKTLHDPSDNQIDPHRAGTGNRCSYCDRLLKVKGEGEGMINQRKYIFVLILVWLITLTPSMYYAYRQVQENFIVEQYLSLNNMTGLPINKATAVHVSNQVRKDFNINEKTFVALRMADRPFLREDVGFLLTYKEGLCGEGARVIVNLLYRLGFDATRITLFNKYLQASHTLVSVLINGHEFFIDSINSSKEVNRFLINNNISTNDFNLMHYTGNIASRRHFSKTNSRNKTEDYIKFFSHYWLYSYEAIPYTKLLTKIGLDVRVFNFHRPNRWISIMAERPNTIMCLVSFGASILLIVLLHKLRIVKAIMRMNSS